MLTDLLAYPNAEGAVAPLNLLPLIDRLVLAPSDEGSQLSPPPHPA